MGHPPYFSLTCADMWGNHITATFNWDVWRMLALRGLKVTVSPSTSYRLFINLFLRFLICKLRLPHTSLEPVTSDQGNRVCCPQCTGRDAADTAGRLAFSRSLWLSCTSFWIRTCPTRQLFFLLRFSLSLGLGMCSLSFSNLSKPVSLSLHFASRLFTFLYSVFLGFLLTLWLTVWLRGCLPASSSPPFLVLLMVVPTPLTLCFLIPFEFEPVKFALLTDSSWLLGCPPAPLLIV